MGAACSGGVWDVGVNGSLETTGPAGQRNKESLGDFSELTVVEKFLNADLTPHFLAIGLGTTNMVAMLFALAHGKQTVGVELRGDPFLVRMPC